MCSHALARLDRVAPSFLPPLLRFERGPKFQVLKLTPQGRMLVLLASGEVAQESSALKD